jgi:hypothetical protein
MTAPTTAQVDISQDDFESLLKAAMNASWNDGKRGATQTSEKACDTSDAVVEAFIALRSALTASEKRLDWLERRHTLHNSVDIVHVVDGYEVHVTEKDGNDLICEVHGETLREAIDRAMEDAP